MKTPEWTDWIEIGEMHWAGRHHRIAVKTSLPKWGIADVLGAYQTIKENDYELLHGAKLDRSIDEFRSLPWHKRFFYWLVSI